MAGRFFILGFTLITIFSACSCDNENDITVEKPTSTSINKILPLGASRVQGARPEFESYRYELWKKLTAKGWMFDYIGTMTDEANYTSTDFDHDHEGRGGWTSGQILQGITGWLDQTGAPDIVLFSSPGGNDALENLPYEEAVANIHAVIDAIQTANPNVTIIIEQMAPGRSDLMTPTLTNYFDRLQQEVIDIANQQSTSSSKVIPVNMFTDFEDAYLADEVHYNEAGAAFIAERYYEVLKDVLLK